MHKSTDRFSKYAKDFMYVIQCVFLSLILFGTPFSANAKSIRSRHEKPAVIMAVGDILLDRGVAKQIEKHGYAYPFHHVRNTLHSADIVFGNLECPLAQKSSKVVKLFCFKANPLYRFCLKNAGIDMLSLANNHSLDCGKTGLSETMGNLNKIGIQWCGAGFNINEAMRAKIVTKKGIRIAFVGFCEFIPEYVTLTGNKPGIVTATEENIRQAVSIARKHADIVVASFHWGIEFRKHPTDKQKHLAHVAVECGADIVLGHHPHVLQDIAFIKHGNRNAVIAYSLGNFVFDQRLGYNKERETTGILKIVVTRNGVKGYRLMPATINQCAPILAAN